MKLVQAEPESEALRRFLRRHSEDERVTSTLARVEVVRALQTSGVAALAQARRQLGRLHQITLDNALLDSAATLAPGTSLRSLDAIHLTSARLIGAQLRSVLTYDRRMADAAAALGLPIDAPR